MIRRGTITRRFRTVPIGRRKVMVDLPVQRVECRSCGVVQQVKLGFASRRVTYSDSFERYVIDLCRYMTIANVAAHLGVSWGMIKEIHKRHLRHRYGQPSLKGLTYIAIDEICVGHGQRFLTIVLNLQTGAAIFVGQGKGKEALEPFWKRLGWRWKNIKAVAIDMGQAYLGAVWEHLPKVPIVFDRFHVVKLFNEKLTQLRRQVQNAAQGLAKNVLKCTRWLLLKNPQNLDQAKNEHARLEEALRPKRATCDGLLPQGGSPSVLGAAGQELRRTLPAGLAGASRGVWTYSAKEVRKGHATPRVRPAGLV